MFDVKQWTINAGSKRAKQWSKEHLEKIILSNKDVCWSEFVKIKLALTVKGVGGLCDQWLKEVSDQSGRAPVFVLMQWHQIKIVFLSNAVETICRYVSITVYIYVLLKKKTIFFCRESYI